MKRISTILLTMLMVVCAYGQKFQPGVYKESEKDVNPGFEPRTITFNMNGTFKCEPLYRFPTLDNGLNLSTAAAVGEVKMLVSGTYSASNGTIKLKITGATHLRKEYFSHIINPVTFNYGNGWIDIADSKYFLDEKFESAKERKAREAQEAREYAKWEKQQVVERKAGEARLAAERRAKAKQWDAVMAAKKGGKFAQFKAEIDKYVEMGLDIDEQCKTFFEMGDFLKNADEYDAALESYETIAGLKGCSSTNIDKAKTLWNELAPAAINKNKDNPNRLCELSKKSVISDTNKAMAMNFVREHAYNNVVLANRDFSKVLKTQSLEYEGVKVFDKAYVAKIRQYSEKLRTDSITNLLENARGQFGNKNYQRAKDFCNMALDIDSGNVKANNVIRDAEYEMLMAEHPNTIEPYVDYLKKYPDTSHLTEVSDICVDNYFNNQSLYKEKYSSSYSHLGFLQSLSSTIQPGSANKKRLDSAISHYRRKEKRHDMVSCRNDCRSVSVVLGGAIGFSAATEFAGSAELGLKFIQNCKFLNIYLGAKYQYVTGTPKLWLEDKLAGDFMDGYITAQHFSIPAEIRFNLLHKCDNRLFLGLGAEYAIPLASKFTYVNPNDYSAKEAMKDKSFLNPAAIWPRVSLAYGLQHVEFGLKATYIPNGLYDKERLRTFGADELIGNSQFDKQTNSKINVEVGLKFIF